MKDIKIITLSNEIKLIKYRRNLYIASKSEYGNGVCYGCALEMAKKSNAAICYAGLDILCRALPMERGKDDIILKKINVSLFIVSCILKRK